MATKEERPLDDELGSKTIKDVPNKKNYPWGISNCKQNLNEENTFSDVMSEDLAKNLNISYQMKEQAFDIQDHMGESDKYEEDLETHNDLLLSQMLQYEYDREFDSQLHREERHLNKNSKLSISFSKYKVCPEWYGSDSEEDIPNLDEENRILDSFEARVMDEPVIPPCGYICHNNQIVTKHDTRIAARKNAERIMNLPPGVNTGDGGGFDMEISNKVYNQLLNSSKKDGYRKSATRKKVHDKAKNLASKSPVSELNGTIDLNKDNIKELDDVTNLNENPGFTLFEKEEEKKVQWSPEIDKGTI